MLNSRKWLFVVITALLTAGLILLAVRQKHNRDHKLPDHSVLRVEKISSGKRAPFKIGGWLQELKEQLQKRLPKNWSSRLFKPAPLAANSSWYMNGVVHTNNDALWIWLTRRDPVSGNYQNVDIGAAELLDAHGCPFGATQLGGSDDGRLPPATGIRRGAQGSVEWLLFEAFPRHEKSFRLRLYDWQHKFLTDFSVPNPACTPMRASNWAVQSFPITKPFKDATFILTGVKIRTRDAGFWAQLLNGLSYDGQAFGIEPIFKFLEGGRPSTAWQALDMELYDSSGNFASKLNDRESPFLCPHEPAWKLRVKFFGSDESRSASNVAWTVRAIKVSGLGEFIPLDAAESLEGVRVKALALAGPGSVTYSNDLPIKATSELPSQDGLYPITSQSRSIKTVSFKTHHIAMSISALTQDQRLTIRATDDQGRQFYAQDWQQRYGNTGLKKRGEIQYLESNYYFGRGPTFFKLDLPADSKTVDLTFCIHNSSTAEFIFKPRTPEEKPDKKSP